MSYSCKNNLGGKIQLLNVPEPKNIDELGGEGGGGIIIVTPPPPPCLLNSSHVPGGIQHDLCEASGQVCRVGKYCARLLPQPPQNNNRTTEQPSLRIA